LLTLPADAGRRQRKFATILHPLAPLNRVIGVKNP